MLNLATQESLVPPLKLRSTLIANVGVMLRQPAVHNYRLLLPIPHPKFTPHFSYEIECPLYDYFNNTSVR